MKSLYIFNHFLPKSRCGKIIMLFFCVLMLTSCEKFVDVDPPTTNITGPVVYENNISAAAVMSGLFSTMMASPQLMAGGSRSISLACGLAADELKNYYSTDIFYSQLYTNSLTSATNGTSNNSFWGESYNYIYQCNAVLEGLNNSNGVTEPVKKWLSGEARFLRAFCYFYLVNIFGDVPLPTTTNYLTNKELSRTAKEDIYKFIVEDLLAAQLNLGEGFVDGNGTSTTEKVRPNKVAATALLARVYLYTGDWAKAEAAATEVINNTTNNSITTDLSQVFLANSSETIWALRPVNPVINTFDAYYFVLASPPGGAQHPVALSSNVINAFEPGDKRLTNWTGEVTADSVDFYQYPYKYKVNLTNQPLTEYLIVLRIAEQYLIRAEARAQLENFSGSAEDLNVIRDRADLDDYAGVLDQPSLLAAILHERQVELFTEWGHRWFDLKRTGNINTVMSEVTPLKGGTWDPDFALFPLPFFEVQTNPSLKQNPGYQ